MGSTLAIHGGSKLRREPFTAWPVWDEGDVEAVAAVIRGGAWGRLNGDRVRSFESAFAAAQGGRHCLAVVNGSVALRLALLAIDIQAGDEVIVPPYTFLATATSVVEANAIPIFADIEAETFCLDPAAFEAAITPRTRAVIPVHLGGQAADMDRILEIAARHDIAVIEDAAHAHGASYRGRGLGSLGDLGCFSFQSSKNLTSGEGGAILTESEDLYDRCMALHHCGRRKGGEWYEHPTLGGNYRLSEMQGALLLRQLSRLEAQTETRNANGLYLNELLAAIPGITPLARGRGETRHAYHLYPFRFDADVWGIPRARFIAALQAEGIPVSAGYTVPLYRQGLFLEKAFGPYTGYRHTRPDLSYKEVALPVCERICTREGCWLPQAVLLGRRGDMDDIAAAVKKVYDQRDSLREA